MRIFSFAILPCYFAVGLLQAQESSCHNIEEQIQTTRTSGPREHLAKEYKRLGDCFLAAHNRERALMAYQKALSFPYPSLSSKERLAIVESLRKLDETELAVGELTQIIYNEPGNEKAQALLNHLKGGEAPAEKRTPPECWDFLIQIQEAEENG